MAPKRKQPSREGRLLLKKRSSFEVMARPHRQFVVDAQNHAHDLARPQRRAGGRTHAGAADLSPFFPSRSVELIHDDGGLAAPHSTSDVARRDLGTKDGVPSIVPEPVETKLPQLAQAAGASARQRGKSSRQNNIRFI
jgi:hypothetical protein